MIILHLETKNDSQRVIKEYLQANVSQALADKINNGVNVQKDDLTLVNKKDLDGFWTYACKEARKTGNEYVDNETVFGWAIHYFEENAIEGTLYNQDGTKYSKPIPQATLKVPTPNVPTKPTPPKPQQFSLFELLNENNAQNVTPKKEPEEQASLQEQVPIAKTALSEQCEAQIENNTNNWVVDETTGEILSAPPYALEQEIVHTPVLEREIAATSSMQIDETDEFEKERALQQFFDKDALCELYELFEYNFDMQ